MKSDCISDLTQNIKDFFKVNSYKPILDFVVEDIDLSDDVSSDKNRVDLKFSPHLIQPLQSAVIEQNKRKQVVVAFPEQMGKTLMQMCSILYNTTYQPNLQTLIIYPSQELSVQTSQTKFIPLFKKIKQFQSDLKKPFAIRGDRMKLSNSLIFFGGAGNKIVSRSCKMVVGDECAVWSQVQKNGLDNMQELKKRTRSYDQCLQLFVSTPSYKEDKFWNLFLSGSQGYYHLRCRNCNNLTMRSADLFNLQFESDYDQTAKQYYVKKGSCRLICPICKHEHTEEDREWMIDNGGYIHVFEQRITENPSFQCGVLASKLRVHNWENIAQKQLQCGKGSQLADFKNIDNSLRGLPYQQRNYKKVEQNTVTQHFFDIKNIKQEQIEAVYLIADTQDTFSVVGVFALDINNNSYLLDLKRVKYLTLTEDERLKIDKIHLEQGQPKEVTVLDLLNKEYFGIKPLYLLIDSRGHRTEEIKRFSQVQKNIVMYSGSNLKYDLFKKSDVAPKLFLFDAKKLQAEVIFKLYHHTDKKHGYLYLCNTLKQKDINQILACKPDNTKKNGNIYENWTFQDRVHDVFDVLKMYFGAVKLSLKIYSRQKFRHGKASVFQGTKTVDKKPKFVVSQGQNNLFTRRF